MDKDNRDLDDQGVINQRQAKQAKIERLQDYKDGYTSDQFIDDLVKYFDGEVDFDLGQVRKEIERPQRLPSLIIKAKENNTHPVTEFLADLFRDLTD